MVQFYKWMWIKTSRNILNRWKCFLPGIVPAVILVESFYSFWCWPWMSEGEKKNSSIKWNLRKWEHRHLVRVLLKELSCNIYVSQNTGSSKLKLNFTKKVNYTGNDLKTLLIRWWNHAQKSDLTHVMVIKYLLWFYLADCESDFVLACAENK